MDSFRLLTAPSNVGSRAASFPTGETSLRANTCRMWRIRVRAAVGAAVKINGRLELVRERFGSPKTMVSNHLSGTALLCKPLILKTLTNLRHENDILRGRRMTNSD